MPSASAAGLLVADRLEPSVTEPAPPARAGIAAIGAALPPAVVANATIARRLGVDDGWIVSRTGVRERRVAAAGESLAGLATEAGAKALARSRLAPEDLDLVVVATFTPDALLPHAAPLVAERLRATRAGALDVGAACAGFVSALALAAAQAESGRVRSVLVIGADLMSRVTDRDDRATAGLFGDGAGAALITAGGPGAIGPIVLGADGACAGHVFAGHAERLLRMDGRATFRAATARLCEATRDAAEAAGVGLEEIDLFVYHQANSRILAAVGERLGLPEERVIDCIATHGNTSAASVPLALAEAARQGRLQAGAKVLLGAFGAGFTWGAGVVEWGVGA